MNEQRALRGRARLTHACAGALLLSTVVAISAGQASGVPPLASPVWFGAKPVISSANGLGYPRAVEGSPSTIVYWDHGTSAWKSVSRLDSSSWTAPRLVANDTPPPIAGRVVGVEHDGVLSAVVPHPGTTLSFRTIDPVLPPVDTLLGSGSHPAIHQDGNGIHLVAQTATGVVEWDAAGTAVGAPTTIEAVGVGEIDGTPVVADDGTDLVVAWQHTTPQGGGVNSTEIRWSRRHLGTWSAPAALADPVQVSFLQTPLQLTMASGGTRAVLAVVDNSGNLSARTFSGGSWSATQPLISSSGVDRGDLFGGAPLAVSSAGDAIIATGSLDHTFTLAAGESAWTQGPLFPHSVLGAADLQTPSSLTYEGSVAHGIAAFGTGTATANVATIFDYAYTADLPTSRYVPVTPARVLDTRPTGPQVGYVGSKPGPGAVVVLHVLGAGGVAPSGVSAVVVNVTATNATAPGFVTVYPAAADRPLASNLNITSIGQTIANLVVVPVEPHTGNIALYTQSGTDLVADVEGYFASATASTDGREIGVQPARILDTRPGPEQTGYTGPKPAADQVIAMQVTGVQGVPSTGVAAVVLNVTATQSTPGWVTAWPAGLPKPLASNVNTTSVGQTIPNQVMVPVGTNGVVNLFVSAPTHLVADVAGYFTDASAPSSSHGLFVPIVPTRFLDTRTAYKIPLGASPVSANGAIDLTIGDTGPIPSSPVVGSVVANVTAVQPSSPGYITIWPSGSTRPLASNLNFDFAGQIIPNLTTTPLGTFGTFGRLSIFSTAATDVIVDVSGFYLS